MLHFETIRGNHTKYLKVEVPKNKKYWGAGGYSMKYQLHREYLKSQNVC